MSLQQLEAFLAWAEGEPSLQVALTTAPDATAVAAIAAAAGFAVSSADLLEAAGEPPEVFRMVELVSVSAPAPPTELEAFLQQVECDGDLQRVLASAPDAEGVAAVARIAGYALSAEDLWAASDESPEALQPPDEVHELWPDAGDGAEAAVLPRWGDGQSGPDQGALPPLPSAAPGPADAGPAQAEPPGAAAAPTAAQPAAGPGTPLRDPWAGSDLSG